MYKHYYHTNVGSDLKVNLNKKKDLKKNKKKVPTRAACSAIFSYFFVKKLHISPTEI